MRKGTEGAKDHPPDAAPTRRYPKGTTPEMVARTMLARRPSPPATRATGVREDA